MSFLSKLFGSGSSYNDSQLVNQAMNAISTDPMISDPSDLVVTSKNGVMTISGIVHRSQEKERIEGVVRNTLSTVGLKHEQIVNELKLPRGEG